LVKRIRLSVRWEQALAYRNHCCGKNSMQEFLPKQELLSHLRRAFFYAEKRVEKPILSAKR